MLIRLMPEQVSASWEVFRPHILKALPTTVRRDPTIPVAILKAILAEKAIMWAICSDATGDQINGLILTTHFVDPISDARSLAIYGMFSTIEGVSLRKDDFADALGTIRKFAVAKGFYNIIAFTNEPSVVRLAKQLGAKGDTYFMEFDLYDNFYEEEVPEELHINKISVVEDAVLIDSEVN